MRRAEKDQVFEARQPRVSGERPVMAGASREESAHAVADDRKALDRMRPGAHERLHRVGEFAPVGRNVPARIVVKVEWRESQVARQRGAVIVAVALPLQVVQAQPVDQHKHAARGLRKRRRQRIRCKRERRASDAERHRNGQRIRGFVEVIAEHPVERRQDGLALWRGRPLRHERGDDAEQRVDTAADEPGHASYRPVDETGDSSRSCGGWRAGNAGYAQDRTVDGFDEVGHAHRRVARQAMQSARVREVQVVGLRHDCRECAASAFIIAAIPCIELWISSTSRKLLTRGAVGLNGSSGHCTHAIKASEAQ